MGMSRAEFIDDLSHAGIATDIADRLWLWISAYYGRSTTPHCDDRMKAAIAIDPDDISDFVADFYRDNGLAQPTPRNPEVLEDYSEMTLRSLAHYLHDKRKTRGQQPPAS